MRYASMLFLILLYSCLCVAQENQLVIDGGDLKLANKKSLLFLDNLQGSANSASLRLTAGNDLIMRLSGSDRHTLRDDGRVAFGKTSGLIANTRLTLTSMATSSRPFEILASIGSGQLRVSETWENEMELSLFDASAVETVAFYAKGVSYITGGNMGFGTAIPNTKVQVRNGDIYVESIGTGVILKSPNGSCFRITISDMGELLTDAISCP